MAASSQSQKTPNLDGKDKSGDKDKDKDKEEEEPTQKTDDDPDGMKLVGSGVDGLEEARKLWASMPLERVLAEWKDKSDEKLIETLVVGYDIAIRRRVSFVLFSFPCTHKVLYRQTPPGDPTPITRRILRLT